MINDMTRNSELSELKFELEKARAKFPDPVFLFAALCEEVGELARAFLGDGDVKKEALQSACVATRIFSEGDPVLEKIPDSTIIGTPQYTALLSSAVELELLARHVLRVSGKDWKPSDENGRSAANDDEGFGSSYSCC